MVADKSPRIPVPKRVERMLDTSLDKALGIQRPVVQAYLDRARRRQPGRTPAQVVARLDRQYLTAVTGIGGASGAAAAVPGVGTAASLATGAADLTAFVSASAMYVLALAELHQVPITDPAVRRALVLSVLVGDGGEAALEGLARGESRWAQVIARRSAHDTQKLAGLNGQLTSLLLRRMGTRQGALMIGRAVPLGIGAVIGAGGNLALARGAITAARKAFGAPPDAFPPRVVEVPAP